jgi:phage portal protein BeeE
MGLWSRMIRRRYAAADSATLRGGDVAQIADLPASVALAFGVNAPIGSVTRAEAMSLPVIRQGRNLIAATIGTFPLVCERVTSRGVTRIDRSALDQPDWSTTRAWTITWTVDDLLFRGYAWWRTLGRDSLGYPVRWERLDGRRVRIDYATGELYVDGVAVDPRDIVRFDGPDEGLLSHGKRALRTALRLEEAANRVALMDVPLGVLQDQRPGMSLTPTEVDQLLSSWSTARARYNVGYLNGSVKYDELQHTAQEMQLVEARQHQARELARLMGLDASAVNAPTASGMTYQNGVAERRSRVDTAFRPYMAAIADRLSLGDITPRGQRVRFDTSDYLRGDAGEAISAAVAATGGPVMSTDEARDRLLDMPPAATTVPAPQEATP